MGIVFYEMKPLSYQKVSSISTPLRQVVRYEIEYQLSDGGESRINDCVYPIKCGQLLLAKPGMVRNTTGTYQCLAMHFSCRDESFCATLNALPDVLSTPNSGFIEELLRSAYKTRVNSESLSLRLEGILMQILAEYVDASQRTERIPREYQRYVDGIYQTVEYMHNNFSENITCDILAKQMFISTNFYQKIFKKIMDISPAQYLRDIRISEACRLLTFTDLSIQEIAEQCGFSCSSYFIYVLRKHMGITPLEYRKANQTLL